MTNNVLPYANAIIRLLQGIIYIDDKEWTELTVNHSEIRNYFSGIGHELFLDNTEGYAFLKQKDFSEEDVSPINFFSDSHLCITKRKTFGV